MAEARVAKFYVRDTGRVYQVLALEWQTTPNRRGQGHVTRSQMSVRPYVRAYVRPSSDKVSSISVKFGVSVGVDARRYAVWPDPRSRSRALES